MLDAHVLAEPAAMRREHVLRLYKGVPGGTSHGDATSCLSSEVGQTERSYRISTFSVKGNSLEDGPAMKV